MASEKEKEEIIELTEVLEEGPAFPGKNERSERLSPEDRNPFVRPAAANGPPSGLPDSSPRVMKESLAREAEIWTSREGTRIVERVAADFVPRMVKERLASELEKFKAETEALRAKIETLKKEIENYQARAEDLNRQAQTCFAAEGAQILEKVAREVFPQMAEKVLRQEIERLKEGSRTSEEE